MVPSKSFGISERTVYSCNPIALRLRPRFSCAANRDAGPVASAAAAIELSIKFLRFMIVCLPLWQAEASIQKTVRHYQEKNARPAQKKGGAHEKKRRPEPLVLVRRTPSAQIASCERSASSSHRENRSIRDCCLCR